MVLCKKLPFGQFFKRLVVIHDSRAVDIDLLVIRQSIGYSHAGSEEAAVVRLVSLLHVERIVVIPHRPNHLQMCLQTFAHRRANLRVCDSNELLLHRDMTAAAFGGANDDSVEILWKIMFQYKLTAIMQQAGQVLRSTRWSVSAGHAFGQSRHHDAVQPKGIPIHLALKVLEIFHHAHG